MRARLVVGLCCAGALALAGCTGEQRPAAPPPSSASAPTTPPSSSDTDSGTPTPSPPGRVFDAAAMDSAVRKILTENYKIKNVGEVSCPPGRPVTDGDRFTCAVQLGGTVKKVPITVTGGDGQYRVDAPE
ncbi:DUF4333 domain-containing protein [Amycolatopsis sp. NPDC059027]|uniref:DUF4333 domain-containing protein n=1 Tax=unclassified Amycolatopsis TaxID=2618356 RepID=UPI00366FEE67